MANDVIRKLSSELVREIAAGEVVGAPADVLKELLENALDAGATRLEVALDEGGIDRVALTDNGAGIPLDELPLAAEMHCTSKLEDFTRIRTLGFRGEGLYAIRNAGCLSVTSRPAAQLGGATLTAQGETHSLLEHPTAPGTRVEVTRLFEALPARRQALDAAGLEGKKCVTLLGRYLLHHPELSVKLTLDGVEKWHYAGGSHAESVKFLWGAVTANRLLPLTFAQVPKKVSGLLSRPELSRPRKDRLVLAVNGRPVRWTDALLKALQEAYRDLLPIGHYPVGVVNLEVPPGEVLVNTAPDKSRVKFLRSAEVCAFFKRAVEELLSGHPLAPALPDLRTFEAVGAAPRSAFPHLRHAGTYRELYLLAEGDGQLWVVDQHAAHERILFEELEARYRREPPLELPVPELLHLSLEEAQSYEERRDELAGRGLRLEPFGGGRWRVRSVPAFLSGHPNLVTDIVKGSLQQSSVVEAWRKVLGRLACLPAVKAGHALSGADAQSLLDALRQCHTPWACPHGRPTALVLSELELARRFGRRGPRAVLSEGAREQGSRGERT